MNITLRQLKVFETVARHQSFTRAAEALYLSQPAVSMQIKQMERIIGLPLFEQVGKRITLTEAGREMYRYSRAIAAQLAEAKQVMEELKGMEQGHLIVTVASTVNYFAARLLAAFCRRYTQVRVSLDVTNREGLLAQLDVNETDIVLMGKPPERSDVIAEPFMSNPLVIIAPAEHHLVQRSQVPIAQLQRERFLMREQGSGTRSAIERFFANRGIRLSGSMEMSSNEAIKQGVEAGLGLGIVSIHTVELELEAGRLAILDAQCFPIRRRWYVVHRRGKRLPMVARAFRDFVLSEAERFVRTPNVFPR